MNVLGVEKEVLDTFGAVSRECAEQMAGRVAGEGLEPLRGCGGGG